MGRLEVDWKIETENKLFLLKKIKLLKAKTLMIILYNKLIKNITFKKIKYIFLIILLSPLLILFLVLRPIILIRFGYFDIERIGIIANVEDFLLHKRYRKKGTYTFDIWVIGGKNYNKQFYLILKRNFLIIKQLCFIYNVLILFIVLQVPIP